MPLNIEQYRMAPKPVEAVLLTENNKNDVARWTGGHASDAGILIPTFHGNIQAITGDYVARGDNGVFFAQEADAFEAKYHAVGGYNGEIHSREQLF